MALLPLNFYSFARFMPSKQFPNVSIVTLDMFAKGPRIAHFITSFEILEGVKSSIIDKCSLCVKKI